MLKKIPWEEYVKEMKARFHNDEYKDPIAELVSLKQTSTVKEFYEEFESLLNLLNLSKDYALSVFVSNLKPEISKPLRLFHPKSLTNAFNLTKQMETIIHNPPKRPFASYTKPPY